MAVKVVMPALEMAQETGKIVRWHKKEGETAVKGDILLEVETDKAVVEIEAPGGGILSGIRALEGAEIPVGQTIAWLVAAGEAIPQEADVPLAARQVQPARSVTSRAPSGATFSAPPEMKISPKARRLAREHGIDLNSVQGTGTGGEILASDILAFVRPKSSPEPSGEIESLNAVGRLTAERMTQSWTTIPHFYVFREADAREFIDARAKLGPSVESARGVRLTATDLLIAVVSRVLNQFPRIHASWTPEGVRLHRQINIAIAVAVEDGVQGPVIHQADKLPLEDIAVRRKELAGRARAGRLQPQDIKDATFTISNLGMHEVDSFSAIITPPQAAALAVGRVADRVVAVDGRPVVRPTIRLTLSCDHRIIGGVLGASFLNAVVDALQAPEALLR